MSGRGVGAAQRLDVVGQVDENELGVGDGMFGPAVAVADGVGGAGGPGTPASPWAVGGPDRSQAARTRSDSSPPLMASSIAP